MATNNRISLVVRLAITLAMFGLLFCLRPLRVDAAPPTPVVHIVLEGEARNVSQPGDCFVAIDSDGNSMTVLNDALINGLQRLEFFARGARIQIQTIRLTCAIDLVNPQASYFELDQFWTGKQWKTLDEMTRQDWRNFEGPDYQIQPRDGDCAVATDLNGKDHLYLHDALAVGLDSLAIHKHGTHIIMDRLQLQCNVDFTGVSSFFNPIQYQSADGTWKSVDKMTYAEYLALPMDLQLIVPNPQHHLPPMVES
jgi:hypothetical protein